MNTASARGLALCKTCSTLSDAPGDNCLVCGTRTRLVDSYSLQRVWAFWIAGMAAYIPGNLLPLMISHTPGGDTRSTIMGGVVTLFHHGSYAIAGVIFIASIIVPVCKFAVIAWVALSIQFRWATDEKSRHHAHEIVEVLGSWSMIDVFVVAALAALIQLGSVMTVEAGPGAEFFATSVILTMLAARSLDTRLIWSNRSE